jgi:hypothetical protein
MSLKDDASDMDGIDATWKERMLLMEAAKETGQCKKPKNVVDGGW